MYQSFDRAVIKGNAYGGSDEKLIGLMDGSWYMFKFGAVLEPDPAKPLQTSLEHSPLSEYLGSHVYQSVGIRTQDTMLGKLHDRETVACRDFIKNGDFGPGEHQLVEFSMIENGTPGVSSANRRTPEYDFTMKVFRTNEMLEPVRDSAIKRFWQSICIDALIGNFDRHAGNWGYIADSSTMNIIDIAPVYDCGSSFYPRLTVSAMDELSNDLDKLAKRVLTFPTVKLDIAGHRPRYQDFLSSDLGRPARNELAELYDSIDMDKVREIIASAPGISSTQSRFLTNVATLRHDLIVRPAYDLAIREMRQKSISLHDLALDKIEESKSCAAIPYNNSFDRLR